MDEKTLVAAADSPPDSFVYREDYLFFGLLVRHGLCRPHDHFALVRAQRGMDPQPTLLKLMADSSGLTEKSRSDMDELMRVLATPELRQLLPSELPEVQTLIQVMEATAVARAADPAATILDPEGPPPEPMFAPALSAGSSPTVKLGGLTSPATLAALSQLSVGTTQLTQDELHRVEKAKLKGVLIGKTLHGHTVLDRLGAGGQGEVYLAKQLSLNRYVALKKLDVPNPAAAELFIESFKREAQTLARINHARIVKIYEIFSEGGLAFFTMEHLNGKTLKDLVKDAEGPVPLEVVANLACQACSALARTSEDGLVHCDIKPANMMLDENGDLKLLDFGLAGLQTAASPSKGFMGTPQFCSPEQAKLVPVVPASDQYSLGATLYYVLTGQPPFNGSRLTDVLDQHINKMPDAPSSLNTQLPREVDTVILRMMAKDPKARYPDFNACYEDWQRILVGDSRVLKSSVGNQLLGESLLRLSREEKTSLIKRSLVLAGAWLCMVIGAFISEKVLRRLGLPNVLEWMGLYGTYLLAFSLSCIGYVALARRKWLPTLMSLRTVLYIHIATAIPAIAMILIHSGNFFGEFLANGQFGLKPVLSILMSTALLITAISGSVGLMIFRTLRRQLQLQQLELRGKAPDPKEQMAAVLSAKLLSGWRLVHYPLAVLFVLLTIIHILDMLRFRWG